MLINLLSYNIRLNTCFFLFPAWVLLFPGVIRSKSVSCIGKLAVIVSFNNWLSASIIEVILLITYQFQSC